MAMRQFIVLALMLLGCGGGTSANAGDEQLLVSAAASLTEVFTAIGASYEAAHPGVDVVFNFAGSSALREQALEGAPVDVFASADRSNVALLEEDGLVDDEPAVFATNRLELAVPPGNPAAVSALADLGRDELLVGLCAAGVPCGDLARSVLAAGDVEARADTEEPNVTALVTKVAAGELDVALVYVTDIANNDAIDGVPIPEGLALATEYTIAVLAADDAAQAGSFAEFILSAEGQAILAEHGFGAP